MSLSVRVNFHPLQVNLSCMVPLPSAQVLMPLMPPTKVFSDDSKVIKVSRQFDTCDVVAQSVRQS